MRALVIGVGIVLVALLISLIMQTGSLFPKITGSIGLLSLLLGAILSGALNNGDRIRANFATENVEDRRTRTKFWISLIIFGVPNLAASIIYSILL